MAAKAVCDWPNAIRHSRSVRGSTASHYAISAGRHEARGWRWAYFSQPIFGVDRSLCSLHIRRGVAKVGTIGVFSRKMARPAGFEPATPGLEGRSGEKTRNNTEQNGTESWFVCRVALLPHCVQDRVRDASGPGKRWIVASPHAPRRRRRTLAPMLATGATRGPVRGVWGRGGGCGRGGGIARRGPAVGLMAGGARPETDAHRGIIGRSWPSKSPLRGRYAAPTGRLGCPSPPPHIPLPCRAHQSECGPTAGRPPAATAKEGPIP